jgi:hypothetical protein
MYPSRRKSDASRLKTANCHSLPLINNGQALNHVHDSQTVGSACDKYLQLHKEHSFAFLRQSMNPGKMPLKSSVKQ